jgi:spore coat polysaccharide biosynthesis protein SpsF
VTGRTVAVVQARTGSTRFPGKVLADLEGRPMLRRQLDRLSHCTRIDHLVVATTDQPADDPVVLAAAESGATVYRGSEEDVLGRFVGAVAGLDADVVVRLTGDCPLADPPTVDRVIETLISRRASADYASNVIHRTFPHGLDVEAMFVDTLHRLDRLAVTPGEREHVTLALRERRAPVFLIESVVDDANNADLRWTVDEEIDLVVIREMYRALRLAEQVVPLRDMVAFARDHPELTTLNAEVKTWSPRPSPASGPTPSLETGDR